MKSSSPLWRSSVRRCCLSRQASTSHWSDPLTSLGLSTKGFFNISRKLVELAEEHCAGKIVFVLEGGYDPVNVANGSAAVFDALTSSTLSQDVADPFPRRESDHEFRIAEVRKWHGTRIIGRLGGLIRGVLLYTSIAKENKSPTIRGTSRRFLSFSFVFRSNLRDDA